MAKTNFFRRYGAFAAVAADGKCFFPVALFVVGLFFFSSCNDKPAKENEAGQTAQTEGALIEVEDTSAVVANYVKLKALLLYNTTAKPELQRLLNETGIEKIVFQFFYNNSNNLTLGAWPGKKYNQRFKGHRLITLNRLAYDTSIQRNRLFFGDQDILVDSLAPLIGDTSARYLVFIPKVDHIGTPVTRHVYYEIKKLSSLDLLAPLSVDNISFPHMILSRLGRTNPSPPNDSR